MIPAIGKYRPTAPSGFSAQVLLHLDGTNGSNLFVEDGNGGGVWSQVSGTPVLSTSTPILGSASLSMVNNSDAIGTAWPSIAGFLAGEFTFSFKWKTPASPNSGTIRFIASEYAGLILVLFVEAGLWQWYAGISGASDTRYPFPDLLSPSSNTVYDVAFSRDSSGNIRMALNGIVSSHVYNDTRSYGSHSTLYVGRADNTNTINEIDEVMIIDKCLFTANFTPRTTEFVQGSIGPFV